MFLKKFHVIWQP